MDSVIFQAMALDLNRRLANSRLDKVIQVTAGCLVLKLWTGREKVQLLLKAEGEGAFYLSRQPYTAPAKPPRFCQLLRARLRRLLEVRAEPLDRVVHFVFLGPENNRYDLVLEALGVHGNLILVGEDGKIVDLLKRQDAARKLLPGQPYLLPEKRPLVSLLGDRAEAVSLLQGNDTQESLTQLALFPFSPALAQAIQSSLDTGFMADAIVARLQNKFKSCSFDPMKVRWDDQVGLLPVSLDGHGFESVEEYEDLSALVEASTRDDAQESLKDIRGRLAGVITKQRRRLEKRLERISDEERKQSEPDRFRILAELLLTNLHRFKRGDTSVEVDDLYQVTPTRLTIELDPQKSPQENVERYFKLFRKAKRSGEHHLRRIRETKEEMEWLEGVELSLNEAISGDDLYQVQQELETAGMLKETKGQLGRRQQVRPEDQLYQATTPDGWKIFWGKNSRTNDYVSCRMTGPNDYWFHARGMPGSHLVLKCDDAQAAVSEEDLLVAASFAAGYSKGKDSGKVEVIVAKGRAVSKPKGARPGLVTVEQYRSVIVQPKRLDT